MMREEEQKALLSLSEMNASVYHYMQVCQIARKAKSDQEETKAVQAQTKYLAITRKALDRFQQVLSAMEEQTQEHQRQLNQEADGENV